MSDLNKEYKITDPEIRKLMDKQKKPPKKTYSESPYTMENGTATFLYIVVMVVGAIFYDRVLIWIAATIIYTRFIGRHKGGK